MNSTQMREKLEALLAECKADRDSACINDADRYIEMVFDSILFQCLSMREEIEAIRRSSISFFSHFSIAEREAVKKADEEVWSAMEGVWSEEQEWCCDSDFEDDVEDWLYVEGIYRQLIWAMEYAEEKYGVFQIIEAKNGVE